MKVINVVGARPNFMKVAPLHSAFKKYSYITSKIVHTGQHYDERMSKVFFEQLGMPKPDYYLGVGSGSHAEVTAKVMVEFEKILLIEKPDLVIVVGDVNSTLACAIAAKKLNIKLAHVEAGLRSGDKKMPEEQNRILTDSIADYLFVTEQSGMVHLAREGIMSERVFFVGNVMIDSLINFRDKAQKVTLLEDLQIASKTFVLMTMHRPTNVDHVDKLKVMLSVIRAVGKTNKIIFPLHPRTKKQLINFGLYESFLAIPHLLVLEPQGYLEFIHLMENSLLIITDSGGIQEESTYLKVPCLTVRDSTERPITITLGSNILIPELKVNRILNTYLKTVDRKEQNSIIPPFWDGQAANRIAKTIDNFFRKKSNSGIVFKNSRLNV